MRRFDAIVIGGGLVGTAIAYGLGRDGLKVALIDEGDVAYRASRGNFGLVWVQSKGFGAPHYQRWTRASAAEWPSLAAALQERAGIAIGLEQNGGLQLCLGEAEFAKRREMMEQMRREAGNFGFEYRMLGRGELADMLPGIGPAVTGASWTPYDGHVNSLALFHALHRAFAASGGMYLPNCTVTQARAAPGDFRIDTDSETVNAPKIILAAGLGNAALAPLFGLSAPVRPQRGQILATERTTRAWPLPLGSIRQTPEGTIILGSSEEEVGFDIGQDPAVMRKIARSRRPDLSVAERIADRAGLGGAARHAAGRSADLRRIGALPRRIYRELPQRGHPGRGARQSVRADGGIRRARPSHGAVLG